MSSWLSGGVMQFLGRTSYSLYLIHPLVGWSAQSLALEHTDQWAALAVGLVVSVSCAWIAYVLIERPAIRLSHLVSAATARIRTTSQADKATSAENPQPVS